MQCVSTTILGNIVVATAVCRTNAMHCVSATIAVTTSKQEHYTISIVFFNIAPTLWSRH